MTVQSSLRISLRALSRNKLQTGLTMLGMTIGVATVLTMISVGTGAETAIEDQIRAAGMNLTAGNYKVKTEDDFGVVEPEAYHHKQHPPPIMRIPVWNPAEEVRLIPVHAEDDPLAVHDHPTARQRLGDSEAGLGSAATLTSGDANAIRKLRGVQFVSEGVHQNVHAVFGDKRWFTRLHGDDYSLPKIRRAWVFKRGRFYKASEEKNSKQVVVLGSVVAEKLFGTVNPMGKTITIWKQPFDVIGVVDSGSWMVPATMGDDQFDAIYVPFTTIHRLLNLSKLNGITITCSSTGEVTSVSNAVTALLKSRNYG